ncbi:hotdog domain-containing protein [Pedobacter steynii]
MGLEKTGVVIAHASLEYIVPIFLEDKISIYVRTSRIGKAVLIWNTY